MRTAAPDPQLLGNGDILAPVERADDGWGISRVSPGESGYAQRLRVIQERNRRPGLFERGVSLWLTGVLVLLGIPAVAMIVLMAAHAA